jgi:hypothetical protein
MIEWLVFNFDLEVVPTTTPSFFEVWLRNPVFFVRWTPARIVKKLPLFSGLPKAERLFYGLSQAVSSTRRRCWYSDRSQGHGSQTSSSVVSCVEEVLAFMSTSIFWWSTDVNSISDSIFFPFRISFWLPIVVILQYADYKLRFISRIPSTAPRHGWRSCQIPTKEKFESC